MNLNEISIWVGRVFDGLYIGWPYKTMLGIVFLALGRHLELFTEFACIVCVDLFAKFIALSYGYLTESMAEKPSLIDSVKGIPAAHRAGVINSYAMRTQFIEKISVYMLLVVAGALVDFMLGRSEFANLVIAYLASSELLSIVENLDDAGVSAVHDLAGLIKRKRV